MFDETSRRAMLKQAACGFGGLAFADLFAQQVAASHDAGNSLASKPPMFSPRARRVIFIFMGGGPSHVDTFDYKPELIRRHETEISFTGVRSSTFGKVSQRKLMRPLWDFSRYGESGHYVSDLFPEMAKHVDKMCFIHSMHTEGVAHGPSTLFLHTGATNLVRPSVGSWVTYGLGTESENLPGFVTISPSGVNGGPRNYSNAFLPTIYQGTTLGRVGQPAKNARIRNIENTLTSESLQQRQFEFMQRLNRQQLLRDPGNDVLDAAVESFELAYRMQMHAPELMNISDESEATLQMYGIDQPETEDFGHQCLLARKLAEAGVRYIQLNYSDETANPRWDQHSNMPKHAEHAKAIDRPCAGLLQDLAQRGLLEDTLVWWGGEFGRTPFSQSNNGRDHNPRGFTTWLAGGGVKPGYSHGQTDEIGHEAVQDKVHMHDLHATILHLLGLDHERLTYRHAGRDFRLTDVYGRVVSELFA
ncbi:MAG: DUF1501 domain-containing protein [Pirellulaceae bacterium]